MDCGHVQERLDLIPPDRTDPVDPEVRAARAHLGECPDCAEEVRSRQEFDRAVGIVMRDVPVPPGLKSRLILALTDPAAAAVAQPSTAAVSDAVTRPDRSRRSRRRWIASAAAAVVALVCGVSWQLLHQGEPAPLSLAVVVEFCAEQSGREDQLPAFRADWDPQISDGRWDGRVAIPGAPRGADLDGDGLQDAALYKLRGGAFLVVLAPGRVPDPLSGSASSATKSYTPMPHVAWTIGEQVYVCYLPSGQDGNALQRLVDAVYRPIG